MHTAYSRTTHKVARTKSSPTVRAAARRLRLARKRNLALYFGIWLAFYAYAVGSGLLAMELGGGAIDVMSGIERFLPLQLVAAIAAVAVFFGGRRLRGNRKLQMASMIPATATVLSAVMTIGLAGFFGTTSADPRLPIAIERVIDSAETTTRTSVISL